MGCNYCDFNMEWGYSHYYSLIDIVPSWTTMLLTEEIWFDRLFIVNGNEIIYILSSFHSLTIVLLILPCLEFNSCILGKHWVGSKGENFGNMC